MLELPRRDEGEGSQGRANRAQGDDLPRKPRWQGHARQLPHLRLQEQGHDHPGTTFSHSITREGRKCRDCHGTKIVRDLASNTFVPVRWENGKATNIEGVIPVLEGMAWNVPFLTMRTGSGFRLSTRPSPC